MLWGCMRKTADHTDKTEKLELMKCLSPDSPGSMPRAYWYRRYLTPQICLLDPTCTLWYTYTPITHHTTHYTNTKSKTKNQKKRPQRGSQLLISRVFTAQSNKTPSSNLPLRVQREQVERLSQWSWRTPRTQGLPYTQGWCTYELTRLRQHCMGHGQVQGRWGPSPKLGKCTQAASPNPEATFHL